MSVTTFISSGLKVKPQNQDASASVAARHCPRWRHLRPSNYQRNVVYSIVAYLQSNKHTRRKDVYAGLLRRWGLNVETKRIYVSGGVGTWSWLPRRGCIRLQVGASRIDSRKQCFPYAPVVEIYDNFKSMY